MGWLAGEDITGDRLNNSSCILVHDGAIGSVTSGTNFTVSTWLRAERNGTYGGLAMWDAGTPGRITIRRAGPYKVGCKLAFSNNTGGDERDLYVLLNSTSPGSTSTIGFDAATPSIQTGGGCPVDTDVPVELDVGDYLQVVVYQNSGSTLSLWGNTFSGAMRFWALWQGEASG